MYIYKCAHVHLIIVCAIRMCYLCAYQQWFTFKYSITTAGHSYAVDGVMCTAVRGYEVPGVFPHHPP